MREYALIMLNMFEYTNIYLNKRVLHKVTVQTTEHYRDRDIFRTLPNI